MSKYAVTFSFTQPQKKYKSFFLALDKLGAVKVIENTFFVKTDFSVEEMRVALLPYLQKSDGLVIASVHGETAVRNARCSAQTLKELLVDE